MHLRLLPRRTLPGAPPLRHLRAARALPAAVLALTALAAPAQAAASTRPAPASQAAPAATAPTATPRTADAFTATAFTANTADPASSTPAAPAASTSAAPAPSLSTRTSPLTSPRTSPRSSVPASLTSTPSTEVTWSVRPADNHLGSSRPHFTYTLPPGTRVTDGITVTNRGDAPITLRVYASDAFTTPTGGLDLLPADKKPTDVGAWTRPADTTLTLGPQQSRTVPFTLTVPSAATPGDHTGGIVTSLVTGNGSGVQVDRRLGSRIYLRVPGVLTPALKVTALHAGYDGTANPFGAGATRLTYTVTNTGNTRVTARQQVRVSGLFGAFSGSTDLPALPELLPGDSLTRSAVIQGAWPVGPLRAEVLLTPVPAAENPAGQGQSAPARAAATTTAWAWPWPQAVLLLLLAATGYGIHLLRRRARRTRAAAVDKAVAEALSAAGQ